MAMDFFEHQEQARKKTGLLVSYFVLAVVCIIATVYLAFVLILFAGRNAGDSGGSRAEFDPATLWQPDVLAAVGLGTLALVGGGTAYRISSLRGGGHSVAELLGGRPVDPDTSDPDERRLLNVVEEMAIASGTPVPPVYLLDGEESINAFAAGHDPSDAVIGVTRGTVQTLSRDELQGVIAHEFSHILNGDMRLNIKLMGWLYGILLISVVGWILFRSTSRTYYYARNRDDKKGGNPLPLLGLALYVIGYIGVLFGRLIKAAISRQREYLADASAVQFTRNPEGIAGALKKIGALADGSKIHDPEAEEASHMFFGEALGLSAWNPMATHPPLVDRIRRIDPQFDGDFTEVSLEPPTHAKIAAEMAARPRARHQARDPLKFNPVEAITKIGTVGPQNLAYAAALLQSIPEPVQATAREPFGACALVYALLLDESPGIRQAQLDRLAQHAEPPALQELRRIIPMLGTIDAESRLPLVELAIPSLRRLTRDQFRAFVENTRHLMEADQTISLFEYALRRMLLRHLGPHFGWGERPTVQHTTPEPLIGPSNALLSALCRVGETTAEGQQRAYQAGAVALGWPIGAMVPPEAASLKAVDEALKVVASSAPMLKKQVLSACAACIGADGQITLEESELLRAVADSLDCPMPPLLSGAGAMA